MMHGQINITFKTETGLSFPIKKEGVVFNHDFNFTVSYFNTVRHYFYVHSVYFYCLLLTIGTNKYIYIY